MSTFFLIFSYLNQSFFDFFFFFDFDQTLSVNHRFFRVLIPSVVVQLQDQIR